MTAVTATPNRNGELPVEPRPRAYPVLATASVIKGVLGVIDANGQAKDGVTATGLFCVGRFKKSVDNSASLSPQPNVEVEEGVFCWVNGDSITQVHVGDPAFITDNVTVAKLGTGKSFAGIIMRVDSYGVWVFSALWLSAIFNAGDDVAMAALAAFIVQLAAVSNANGASLVGVEDAALRFTAAQVEAVLAELGARAGAPVADATALQAVAAVTRAAGQMVVKLDDMTVWVFDADDAQSASDYVIVPTAGTGRWIKQLVPVIRVADATALQAIAAATRFNGQIAIKLDSDTAFTFDSGSSAGASDWVIVPDAGTGRWIRNLVSLADLVTLKIPTMQEATATLVNGTVTVSAGIVLAATSRILANPTGVLTGTTNYAHCRELFASRTNGADGVAECVIEALNTSGVLDSDAAGELHLTILTPSA